MDEILIKKAIKGDKEALIKLIMLRKDEFYGLAYLYMKNEHDSMNMLQDMIIKLYDNVDKLKDRRKFYSYSKMILVNLCKDELKKAKILHLTDEIEENIEEDSYEINVDEIFEGLEEIYREPIYFKYILGYDYKSISEILNIPLGTVKSRIHNGLKKLREKLGDDYNVE